MKVHIKSIQTLSILVLILLTILAYWKIQENHFIILDDPAYITENQYVRSGFSLENVKWAFSTFYACNWHPLTWLSHMLDYQIYGVNPKGHHLNNLLFHLINTILLFFILNRMTHAFWQSLFVASLFALHPLNVESVAWAAERKNVLSTFFWMLCIFSYIRYSEKHTPGRYFLVMLLFCLGLMSKVMLVTLPFVLLLLDIWPLDRLEKDNLSNLDISPFNKINLNTGSLRCIYLVIEKVPLFLFSAASSVLTILAQQKYSAVMSLESLPLKIRISNAIISYKDYIVKMLWPSQMAIIYPHPENTIFFSEILWSAIVLIIITFLVLYFTIRYRYLFVGWFWYLGTLIPVIGLVQVGSQQMADRYMYIPLIGLFIMFGWGIPSLVPEFRHKRYLFSVSAAVLYLILAAQTYRQVQVWKNSESVFSHALEVTSNNFLAHFNLGSIYTSPSDFDKAIYHFNAAIKINPYFADAHYNLGNTYMSKGMMKEAISHYLEALRINPNDEEVYNNLGIAFASQNNLDEAITHFSKALLINPDYEEARMNLSYVLKAKK